MRAPEGPVAATFFDGETAKRHAVSVIIHTQTPPALIIDGAADALPQRWPLERLRALSDQADSSVLVVTQLAATEDEAPRDPARLVIDDPALANWIRASRPKLYHRDVASGTGMGVAVRVVAALAAFVLILFAILPLLANTLATMIPAEQEAAFGAATVRQLEVMVGGRDGIDRCTSAEVTATFDRLVDQLTDRDRFDAPINVLVLDHEMVNAFAAPGGQIVFFRGMIDKAESPDEITAVLAHEIGHVVARDATRLALRSVGSVGILGLVLGDFAGGGAVLVLTQQLIDSSYSREAETAADTYAFEQLTASGFDPAALGTLFARLRDDFGDVEGFIGKLASHPSLGQRIEAAENARPEGSAPTPSMTDAEWAALQQVCG